MKQFTTLSHKLAGYSAIALAFTGISSRAEAQISYSGVKNTIVPMGGPSQPFDLDGNGTPEFEIKQNHFQNITSYNSVSITRDRPQVNWVMQNNASSNSLAQLNLDDHIQQANPNFGVNVATASMYNFTNQEKFFAIRFDGDKQYIGWVRISISNNNRDVKVIDWAYTEAINGATILSCGDKGTATAIRPRVQSAAAFSVTPTLVNETITVKTETNATYQLVNASGAVVSQGPVEAGESTISTTGLTKGVYLVKLSNQDGSAVTKIVKQ